MSKVQHFLIPVRNMERAKKFYEDVFGWTITPSQDLDGHYDTIRTGPADEKGGGRGEGVINGGMFERGHLNLDTVTVVIEVPSIDDALEHVRRAGCQTVLPKRPVGNAGCYALVRDTENNVIGLWQDEDIQ